MFWDSNHSFAEENGLRTLNYCLSGWSAAAMKKYREMPEGIVPSVATFAPTVMVVNLTRTPTDDTGVDDDVQDAVSRRPFHSFLGLTKEEIAADTVMAAVDKASLLKFGHHVIVQPLVDLHNAPRGRRQLSKTEASITAALRLWTYALLPAIAMQIQGTARSALITDQTYDWLSERAPNLVRLSRKSAAGEGIAHEQPNSEASEWAGDLPSFLGALSDAGRKLSMRFPEEDAPRKGDALRAKVDAITQGTSHGRNQEQNMKLLLAARIHTLDVLAKAKWIATEAVRSLVQETSNSEKGYGRLDGLGPYHVKRNPDKFGKRLTGAARKVIHAQRPSAYVQQTSDADSRLNEGELARVAMLCDIDPFLITAQHILLHDEMIGIREFGRALRGGRGALPYLEYLDALRKENDPAASPGQKAVIEVYQDLPQYLFFEARHLSPIGGQSSEGVVLLGPIYVRFGCAGRLAEPPSRWWTPDRSRD